MLEDLKRRLVRKASRATLGGFRPPESPLASWFGKVLVAGEGEEWPRSVGKPMMPLCQLNLTECPFVPEALSDIALIALFIDPDDLPLDTPNGDGWMLRAYPNLDGLSPVQQPQYDWQIKPFPIRWELLEEDYP